MKTKSITREVIAHIIIAFVFLILMPILCTISPEGIGGIIELLKNAVGQQSDVIISINIFIAVAAAGLIFHYRSRYNNINFLRFCYLWWVFIILNQLMGISGWSSLIDGLKVNLFANGIILPLLCLIVGSMFFVISVIVEEINGYLERTKNDREDEKAQIKQRKQLRQNLKKTKREEITNSLRNKIQAATGKVNNKTYIKQVTWAVKILVAVVVICVLAYIIHIENACAIIIAMIIIGVIVVASIVYGIVKKIKDTPKSTGKTDPKDGNNLKETFFGVVRFVLVAICIWFLFSVSAGSFNFSGIIKKTIENSDGGEESLWELLTSFDFVAGFIGITFIIMVVVFGGFLLYFMFGNIVSWASKGKYPRTLESSDEVPRFFNLTREVTNNLMELIAETSLNILEFARFIPNFFRDMKPVVFEQNADEEYEFQGTVTDASTGRPISDVLIEAYDKSGKSVSVSQTDKVGNYSITNLPSSNERLVFSKDGYKTYTLTLVKYGETDIRMELSQN